MTRSYRVHLVVLLLGLSLLGCSAASDDPALTATALASTTIVAEPTATALTPTNTIAPPTSTVAPPTSTASAIPETPTSAPPTSIASIPANWSLDGTVAVGEYIKQVKVAGVSFSWNTDGEYLYGAMSAETMGWVAVGFDPENMMQGANYVFGYVQGEETFIEDMFGTKPFGSNSHPPDVELGGQDDIVAYAGREADGVTTIEFQIPLDSGDAYDKALDPGEHTLIVSYGERDDFTSIHASRGSGTLVIGE